jgi:hypothetical protein
MERYATLDSILPYKTAALYWVASLTNVKWVLKTQDDAFVYVPNLLSTYVKTLPPPNQPFYGGVAFWVQPPDRNKKSRWYVLVIAPTP